MKEKGMTHDGICLVCNLCGNPLEYCHCDDDSGGNVSWRKWDDVQGLWVPLEDPPPLSQIPEALIQRFGITFLLGRSSVRKEREPIGPHVFVSEISSLENNGGFSTVCLFITKNRLKAYGWTFSNREDGGGGFASKKLCEVRLHPHCSDLLEEAKQAISRSGFPDWSERLTHLIRLVRVAPEEPLKPASDQE